MHNRIPLTGNDAEVPTLFIDTQTPLDELHASAAHRIRAVTQMMESFARWDGHRADAADLKSIAEASVILLRDGCDLLDVLGRRLRDSEHLN